MQAILIAAAILFFLFNAAESAAEGEQPAPAPESQTGGDGAAGLYGQCLAMVKKSPDEAVTMAANWERQGGGAPAQHCRGLGLIAQGYPEDGALELERAGSVLPKEEGHLAAELFGQAAQAWISVDNLSRALHDQNQALELDPENADLLIDRAIVLGLGARYEEALKDLGHAQTLAPDDAEIYAYRAAAYRRLGQFSQAEQDAEKAIKLSPGLGIALLERGYARRKKGDIAGARQDWVAAAASDPDSALASEAQANLESLDLKIE